VSKNETSKNYTSTTVHHKHPANGMSNYKLQF